MTPALMKWLGQFITRYKPDAYFVPDAQKERKEGVAGRKPTELDNTDLVKFFNAGKYYRVKDGEREQLAIWEQFDNIFTGVAQLDTGGNKLPLSKVLIHKILTYVPHISTDTVMKAVGVQERQARRYVAAARIAQRMVRREIEISGAIAQCDEWGIDGEEGMLLEKWEGDRTNDL